MYKQIVNSNQLHQYVVKTRGASPPENIYQERELDELSTTEDFSVVQNKKKAAFSCPEKTALLIENNVIVII
jgi:hypothetical protein